MKDVTVISRTTPAKPRSKNYSVGSTIINNGNGGTTIVKDGNRSSVDIIKENESKSFTDSNVLSALRSVAEFISRNNDSSVKAIIDYLNGIKIKGIPLTRILEKSTNVEEVLDSDLMTALRVLAEIADNNVELKKIFLRKDKADTAQEIITFLKGLLVGNNGHGITLSASGVVTAILDELKNVFSIVSSGFVSGDLGNGFILKYDPETSRSYFEVDELLVRKIAYFVELVIKQLRHVGGEIILTPASMTCIKVEELEDVYRCYFQADDGTKSVMQEFVAGDQARCQTFNIKPGTAHNVTNRYYWRLVTAVGDDYIDLSKTDCDTGSGVPVAKDEIVQLGNRTDATRQNAIILSTVGDDAPSIKQYKGVDGYTLAGKEVTILSATLNKFIGRFVSEATGRSYDDLMSELQADMELIHSQTDKEYTLWFFEYDPGLDNIPASDWTTAELKEMHEQDMFYNRTTGHAWRFEKNADGSFSWNGITDQLTLKALENAAKAQDTADSKRQVFVTQPTDAQAYEVGDQWVNATYTGEGVTYENDSLVCKTAKAAGAAFSISHWQPTSASTTAYIENLGERITLAVTNSEEGIEAAKELANQGIDAAGEAANAAEDALGIAQAAQKTAGENTAAISVTNEAIAALVEKISFDASGNLTNISTSGLVTTADFAALTGKEIVYDKDGHVDMTKTAGLVTTANFASLFTERVTADGLVKSADISTFITEDRAGELISQAVISADQIRFNGKVVANDTFVVDEKGNLTLNNITVAETGEFRGRVSIADGKILLENDGSGSMANGNISWNTEGKTNFVGTLSAKISANKSSNTRIVIGYEDGNTENPGIAAYDEKNNLGVAIGFLEVSDRMSQGAVTVRTYDDGVPTCEASLVAGGVDMYVIPGDGVKREAFISPIGGIIFKKNGVITKVYPA